MDGSRTHRGSHYDPPPILKTGRPTGTYPLPPIRIIEGLSPVNQNKRRFWQIKIIASYRDHTLETAIRDSVESVYFFATLIESPSPDDLFGIARIEITRAILEDLAIYP